MDAFMDAALDFVALHRLWVQRPEHVIWEKCRKPV